MSLLDFWDRFRWPLMHQILWPLLILILATHLGLYWVTVRSISSRKQDELRSRLSSIAEIAQTLNIRLNTSVLESLKGLSGAEFQVVDRAGNVVLSTLDQEMDRKLATMLEERWVNQAPPIRHPAAADTWYLAEVVSLMRPLQDQQELRIFYSLEGLQQEQADAVRPVLWTGACSLLIATSLAVFWALRIGKPIALLQKKIDQVVRGPFEAVSLPRRKDELYDLAVAFNQIGDRLSEYEATIRRTEQVRLLGMVRGGIAHQLHNAITGTRIALEIHQDELAKQIDMLEGNLFQFDREGLDIAFHQLDFMQRFLRQFLALDSPAEPVKTTLDVAGLIHEVARLIQPNAQHLNIAIHVAPLQHPLEIEADKDQIQQALLNLLVNAVESAAQQSCDVSANQQGWVRLEVEQPDRDSLKIKVMDNGGGFSRELQDRLNQPFFSTKPDGIGLGLSVVQQVVDSHHGEFDMISENGITTATLKLPQLQQDP